jgi:predicted nucleotidyltransferase
MDKEKALPSQDISDMNFMKKYSPSIPELSQNQTEIQKKMETTQKELKGIVDWIIKKYPFTQSISVLPQQSIPNFLKEEEVPKETETFIHLYMVVPEEEYKNIPKITKEIITQKIEKAKEKIWLQIKTPVDISENCMDSRFEIHTAIALSLPLYDKGILESLRVAEIHKSLVLRKFEKYVVSYVIGGSFIRGDVTKESDVDTFIVIDDTDVKKMPRLELKERLRTQIFQYIPEAEAMAGVPANKLNVQTYLLTEFWDAVKDANPVMFTFIRDGVPIHDRGTFMPWKSLLRMGKLKPSPEAIETFMKSGDRTKEMVERRQLDAMIDIYWGMITPTQALVMLYGAPPPVPKETVKIVKEIFCTKEKMLELKYLKSLEKIIKYYKDYEHQKLKTLPGKEVDRLLGEFESYMKRLAELRVQIEKRSQEKTIEEIYNNTFTLLKTILGNKSKEKLLEDFKLQFIKTGKFGPQKQKILENIIQAREEFKKGKLDAHKVDQARKDALILINSLTDYVQRCDLAVVDKSRIVLKNKAGRISELIVGQGVGFLFEGSIVKKITDKIEEIGIENATVEIEKLKDLNERTIPARMFNLLEKELGEFDIVL